MQLTGDDVLTSMGRASANPTQVQMEFMKVSYVVWMTDLNECVGSNVFLATWLVASYSSAMIVLLATVTCC